MSGPARAAATSRIAALQPGTTLTRAMVAEGRVRRIADGQRHRGGVWIVGGRHSRHHADLAIGHPRDLDGAVADVDAR